MIYDVSIIGIAANDLSFTIGVVFFVLSFSAPNRNPNIILIEITQEKYNKEPPSLAHQVH